MARKAKAAIELVWNPAAVFRCGGTLLDAMSEFARSCFSEPRRVDPASVKSFSWCRRLASTFELQEGPRLYRITSQESDRWLVEYAFTPVNA